MAEATLRIFYVYVIFRLNGVPCYVGKGKGNRAYLHRLPGHSSRTNRHLAAIYKRARDGGKDLPVCIVRTDLTEGEAHQTERAFILAIGREDRGAGPLVNFTDGGEGHSGFIQSDETKAIRSRKMAGNQIAVGHTPWNTGQSWSEENLAKISAGRKGHATHTAPHTEATKQKISASKKGVPRTKPTSPETRAKLSVAFSGRTFSPETIERMTVAARKREAAKRKVSGQGELL